MAKDKQMEKAAAPKPAATKYKYRHLEVRGSIAQALNQWGKRGWRMVSAFIGRQGQWQIVIEKERASDDNDGD